jgi:hypothetical protein
MKTNGLKSNLGEYPTMSMIMKGLLGLPHDVVDNNGAYLRDCAIPVVSSYFGAGPSGHHYASSFALPFGVSSVEKKLNFWATLECY